MPPRFKHRLQGAAVQIRTQPILEQFDHAAAGHRGIDGQVGGGADTDDERTRRGDLHDLAVTFEFPGGGHRTAGELSEQARVVEEFARMMGAAAPIEIVRRGRGSIALHTRTDGNGDHVLFQPLVVADPGIAAGCQHVDEAILRDHLEADVGIGREEGGHDARQDEARRTDRYVQPQRACRPIPEAVDHIQRRIDLCQRRTEPIQQPRACFGWRDAARGAVEQPYAQARFEPAHGFA